MHFTHNELTGLSGSVSAALNVFTEPLQTAGVVFIRADAIPQQAQLMYKKKLKKNITNL